jgi:hypothetical protein
MLPLAYFNDILHFAKNKNNYIQDASNDPEDTDYIDSRSHEHSTHGCVRLWSFFAEKAGSHGAVHGLKFYTQFRFFRTESYA